jgi:hypothetical protein
LNRNPNDRLGSGGGLEVQKHPFFNSINWEYLYNKKITPPFNPCKNQNEEDSINFEKEFTNMPIDSIDENNMTLPRVDSDTFEKFTYEEESYLDSLRDDFQSTRGKSGK